MVLSAWTVTNNLFDNHCFLKALQKHKRSNKSVASYFKTKTSCNGASKTNIATIIMRIACTNIRVLRIAVLINHE